MLDNYKDYNDPISLLELLKKGDAVALETIFRLYYDKLLHLSKNYLTYEADAEEIVQNVFLKLWEQRDKLKNISSINSYIYIMTKNSCMDYLKHEKVKRGYLDQNLQNKSAINYQFLKDEAASLLLENELEQKILESAELLPEKCKEVFMKNKMEGLKRAEIAQELGISLKTVDNHISKAVKHMRLHLRDFLTLFL
ncbi:MAG: RNA polymerase sigma-70 factor [Ekhidna sp.]